MFFGNDDSLSESEKIDYIYRTLKKQRVWGFFDLLWKWSWRAVTIFSLAYIYLHPDYLVNTVKDQMTEVTKWLPMMQGGQPIQIDRETIKKALEEAK